VATLTATKTPLLTNTLTLTATSKLNGCRREGRFCVESGLHRRLAQPESCWRLDGDGKLDLAASNYGLADGSTVSVLRNTGTTGKTCHLRRKVDYTVETDAWDRHQ